MCACVLKGGGRFGVVEEGGGWSDNDGRVFGTRVSQSAEVMVALVQKRRIL